MSEATRPARSKLWPMVPALPAVCVAIPASSLLDGISANEPLDLRPGQIAALFTEDADYRWHPADEPEVGRDAIVEAWINPGGNASDRDEPGTYVGQYEPYAVDGSRAVAIGTSTYFTDATKSTVERIYYNNWLLEFGDDGKCRSFTEYWITPRGANY